MENIFCSIHLFLGYGGYGYDGGYGNGAQAGFGGAGIGAIGAEHGYKDG